MLVILTGVRGGEIPGYVGDDELGIEMLLSPNE